MEVPVPHARLVHAFVFVKDLDRMVGFYEQALGWWPLRTADPGYIVMRPPDDEGAGVALHQLPDAVAQTITVTSPPTWRDDTAYKVTFATDDLDALRSAILAGGGQAKAPWTWDGATFCECTDPEGNVLQLFEPPGAP